MKESTKLVLATAMERLKTDSLSPHSYYGSVSYEAKIEAMCGMDSERLLEEEGLESVILWALKSLENINQTKKINKAVAQFYKNRTPDDEPLRSMWWRYGQLGSPASLRQYIPKKEQAERKTKALIQKAKEAS